MHNACAAFPAMLAQPSHPSFAPEPPSCMNKDHPPSHLYVHQQRTVEVIQLIEVPPPPPRSHPYTSTLDSDSFASSSSCESSDDDSEEDESVCSSYCSSEENLAPEQAPTYDDTYKTRLNRVLAWREGFAKATAHLLLADDDAILPGAFSRRVASPLRPSIIVIITAPPSSPVSSSPAPSLKRKADDDADLSSDDDMVSTPFSRQPARTHHPRATPPPQCSQSSKRSRSLPPPERTECTERPLAFQTRRLSAHSCSACDACFNTIQSLRQHGKEGPNDACREAVEYGFES